METIRSSETLVHTRATRFNVPEVDNFCKICQVCWRVLLRLITSTWIFKWTLRLVPYDAVNRNKVSICQLSLFYFSSYSLHVSAPTSHPQVRYKIDVSEDYSYYNGSVVRTQLDLCLYWYFGPWSPIHVGTVKRTAQVIKHSKMFLHTVASWNHGITMEMSQRSRVRFRMRWIYRFT
jgi:hypothetical protein